MDLLSLRRLASLATRRYRWAISSQLLILAVGLASRKSSHDLNKSLGRCASPINAWIRSAVEAGSSLENSVSPRLDLGSPGTIATLPPVCRPAAISAPITSAFNQASLSAMVSTPHRLGNALGIWFRPATAPTVSPPLTVPIKASFQPSVTAPSCWGLDTPGGIHSADSSIAPLGDMYLPSSTFSPV